MMINSTPLPWWCSTVGISQRFGVLTQEAHRLQTLTTLSARKRGHRHGPVLAPCSRMSFHFNDYNVGFFFFFLFWICKSGLAAW